MTQNNDTTTTRRIEQIAEGGCEIEGCSREVKVISQGMGMCQDDHTEAAVLNWDPDDLIGYRVEHEGYETIFRAPSREWAEKQWGKHVRESLRVETDPHKFQPKPANLPYEEGKQ